MDDYRTGLARARGLGSAKHGAGHWIAERVSAVALAPLSLWAMWAALRLSRTGYHGALAWLGSPVNAVLVAVLLVVGFWHMHAGLRVVIEDYIHTPFNKTALLLLNLAICVLGVALGLFSVLKAAIGGSAY